MTIAELKVLITGDDSGASQALVRTAESLKAAEDAAQALGDKLAELREATVLGADASDRQVAIYEAMTGRYGDARQAILQLNTAYDQLEARQLSDEGWKRFSAAMQDARQRIAEAGLQTREDRDAFEVFGRTFDQLTPKVQTFVQELARVQAEADRAEAHPPVALGGLLAITPEVLQGVESAIVAQQKLDAAAEKQIEANRQIIELGGRATQSERLLWEVQQGRFKDVDAALKATLESQAKLIEQGAQQEGLEEALRKAQAEHVKLTALSAEERIAVTALGQSYQSLGETQQALIKNSIAPLVEANKQLSDEQRRQGQITSELNHELARQYGEIAKAGADIGPLDQVLRDLTIDTAKLTPENQRLLDQIKKMQPAVEAFKTLSKGVIGLFDHVFNDLFEHGFKGFFSNVMSGFRKMVADMAQEWTRLQLTRGIQHGLGGLFGAGSALSGLGLESDAYDSILIDGFDEGALGGLFDLFGRASGGPVDAGQPYIVGEEGPELFVPLGSGTIVPSSGLGAAVAGGSTNNVVVHNHFQIHTPNPGGFRQSMGQIASETGRSIQKSLRRDS